MNWRRFFRRDEADAEQREELDFYLDITTEEYIERGMEPAEARAAARRKLGNATQIREEVYRMNTLTFMEGVLRDARHALRMIRTKTRIQRSGFAFAGFRHRREYRNLQCVERRPDPAIALSRIGRAGGRLNRFVIQGQVFEDAELSAGMYAACKESARAFESFGVWTSGAATVTGMGDPEQLVTVTATQGVLPGHGLFPRGRPWRHVCDSK